MLQFNKMVMETEIALSFLLFALLTGINMIEK